VFFGNGLYASAKTGEEMMRVTAEKTKTMHPQSGCQLWHSKSNAIRDTVVSEAGFSRR
jgi:hypothetical protein